jgi:hypothetical protein
MNKHHSGTNVLQKGGQMAVLVQIYQGLLSMVANASPGQDVKLFGAVEKFLINPLNC